MTDFRVLCAEVTEALHRYQCWYIEDNGYGVHELEALLRRADAALAQPEPKGPKVMEIIELADEIEAAELGQVDLVRAALARWGRPTPQPIPVSERLPAAQDCDAEGRCWWFCFECPGEHSYWIFAKEVYCEPPHWLPAHALPLPS